MRDGLGGPMDGLGELINGLFSFFFGFLFNLPRRSASVKATINHDFHSEVVAKTASVNAFCPPP